MERAGDVANVVVDDDVQELASVDEAGSLKYLVIVPLRVCVREHAGEPVVFTEEDCIERGVGDCRAAAVESGCV